MGRIIKSTFDRITLLLVIIYGLFWLSKDYTDNYVNLEIFGWITLILIIIYIVLRIPAAITYTRKTTKKVTLLEIKLIAYKVNTIIAPIFSTLLILYLLVLLIEQFSQGLYR
jgi:uncharacterized membrane protein YuzA (DUF378 family)